MKKTIKTNAELMSDALGAFVEERLRQDVLKAQGRFAFTCADVCGLTPSQRLAVLVEEVGEVSRAVLEFNDLTHDGDKPAEAKKKLVKELVQVGAITLAWLEGMGREERIEQLERQRDEGMGG